VHYAGVACEMDALQAIASSRGIALVEDNAHGLFGRFRGRPLGTFGRLAALSFHETKNVTCGEGGALVINDPGLLERAEIIREKGTDRSRFFRREVDKYTWIDVGSSYLPSDLLAAFLCAQLEARGRIPGAEGRDLAGVLFGALGLGRSDRRASSLRPRALRPAVSSLLSAAVFPAHRAGLIAHLAAAGIQAVSHYVPLHQSPMGRRLAPGIADCR
jgi:dTDP-4-amino-4,6-dideoxygalactose transaminase